MDNSYLIKLAADENVEGFKPFLKSYVVDTQTLLDVVEALKSKLHTDTLETHFFKYLVPYFKKHNPSIEQLLKLSHVVCANCDIYKPASVYHWVENNPELFETDVVFFYRLFKFFDIKNTYLAYPSKHLLIFEERYPMSRSDQTTKEKLKVFNTIIKHFDKIKVEN
jgi:hypothetical protein